MCPASTGNRSMAMRPTSSSIVFCPWLTRCGAAPAALRERAPSVRVDARQALTEGPHRGPQLGRLEDLGIERQGDQVAGHPVDVVGAEPKECQALHLLEASDRARDVLLGRLERGAEDD